MVGLDAGCAEAGAARRSPERSWRPPTPCAKNSPPLGREGAGGGGRHRPRPVLVAPPHPPPHHTRASLLAYEFPHNRWACGCGAKIRPKAPHWRAEQHDFAPRCRCPPSLSLSPHGRRIIKPNQCRLVFQRRAPINHQPRWSCQRTSQHALPVMRCSGFARSEGAHTCTCQL
jgi:hypothetical protein